MPFSDIWAISALIDTNAGEVVPIVRQGLVKNRQTGWIEDVGHLWPCGGRPRTVSLTMAPLCIGFRVWEGNHNGSNLVLSKWTPQFGGSVAGEPHSRSG